jgi:integrase
MARKTTGPRYFDSKGGYYVNVKGNRVCLAKGPKDDPEVLADAEKKYHEIMLAAHAEVGGDKAACIAILDAYLCHIKAHRKPATYEIRRRILQVFCSKFGAVRVRDLKPHQVTTWLDQMETIPRPHKQRGPVTWGPGTRGIALTSLKAGFNWAVKEGRISLNPLTKLEKPTPRSRGGEQLLTEEGHQRLLDAVRPFFRDYLIALNDTGARPGEVARVTAADYRPGVGAWVLDKHKTERKGKKRVIYLTPRLVEMVQRLSLKYPEGPIFRNRYGRPWKLGTIAEYFDRLRGRLNLGPVTAYSYRHKFATEFLLKGGSMAYVAELQGTSVAMIEKHYGHLREHGAVLRKALIDFRGAGASGQDPEAKAGG